MKTIGERIKEKRKELGMTQAELAQKLNVTDRAVSKWEVDQGKPDFEILTTLADALGVSLDYLIKGKEPEVRDIVMSKAELICKKNNANAIDDIKRIKPMDEDDNGKTFLEYIEQYNAVDVLKAFVKANGFNPYSISKSDVTINQLLMKYNLVDEMNANKGFAFSDKRDITYKNSTPYVFTEEGTKYLFTNCKHDKLIDRFLTLHKYRTSNRAIDWMTPYKTALNTVIEQKDISLIKKIIKTIFTANEGEIELFNKNGGNSGRNRIVSTRQVNDYMYNYYYNYKFSPTEIMDLLRIGLLNEAKAINDRYALEKVDDNQFKKFEIIHSGNKQKVDTRILDVTKGPILIIEKLLATNDNEFIVKCLKKYPINGKEYLERLYREKTPKNLYRFLADNNLKVAEKLLTKGLTDEVKKEIEDVVVTKAKDRGWNSNLRRSSTVFEAIDNANARYNRDELLTKYNSRIQLEKFYSQNNNIEYYQKLLSKNNLKEAVTELCRIMEDKLNSGGCKGKDLSEKLTYYLESKWPSTGDDGWGYTVELEQPKICDLLHRLRIMRNNYLHSSITEAKPLSKDEIITCADYILNEMED